MRIRIVACLALVASLTVGAGAGASPVYNPKFGAPPGRHVLGEPVAIELVNQGTTSITMGETWDLVYLDGEGTAFYQWPTGDLELEPGESRVWNWDQRVDQCYGECVNVREGDPAPPGRYEVTTMIDGYEETLKFNLGQYFTLGFTSREKIEYIVYVATQEEVDMMTAEAAAVDKTLIVSGLVQKKRAYNPDWNFTMGPRSIVLAEVFVEVCDGSPWYVQKHREDWLRERWCPWSSYVKRVGR